jgi:hypothetical protein
MFEKWNYRVLVEWGIHRYTIATHGAYTTPKYNEKHIDPVHSPVVRTAGLLTDGIEPLGGGRRFERAEHNEIITELRKYFKLFARLSL